MKELVLIYKQNDLDRMLSEVISDALKAKIPVDETIMLKLQLAISSFSVSISFLNPATNELAENVNLEKYKFYEEDNFFVFLYCFYF